MRNLIFAGLILFDLLAQSADLSILVVDENDKPVSEAVVYLRSNDVIKSTSAKAEAKVDQVEKEFIPHVLVVNTGASIHFPNSDNIRHQVYSFSEAKTFEIPLYSGVPAKPVTFDVPGVVSLGCNIHDWMSAHIFVADNNFYSLTDEHGKALIEAVPNGQHSLQIWHEELDGDLERFSKIIKISADETVQLKIERNNVWNAWQGFGDDSGGY